MMNDALTASPADFAGLPAKVIWPIAFFFKKRTIFVKIIVNYSFETL